MEQLCARTLARVEARLAHQGEDVLELYKSWDFVETRTIAKVISYLDSMGEKAWEDWARDHISSNFPAELRIEYDSQYYVNKLTLELVKRTRTPTSAYAEARDATLRHCQAAWSAWEQQGDEGAVAISKAQINYISLGTSPETRERLERKIRDIWRSVLGVTRGSEG